MSTSKTDSGPAIAAGPVSVRSPLKVAIVGFGTVGRSVAKVLSSGIHPSLQLAAICNRDVDRQP
jgi:lactate dehydrogenase-like 2-hydroxyacid dehydrogenase